MVELIKTPGIGVLALSSLAWFAAILLFRSQLLEKQVRTHLVIVILFTALAALLILVTPESAEEPPIDRAISVLTLALCVGIFDLSILLRTNKSHPMSIDLAFQVLGVRTIIWIGFLVSSIWMIGPDSSIVMALLLGFFLLFVYGLAPVVKRSVHAVKMKTVGGYKPGVWVIVKGGAFKLANTSWLRWTFEDFDQREMHLSFGALHSLAHSDEISRPLSLIQAEFTLASPEDCDRAILALQSARNSFPYFKTTRNLGIEIHEHPDGSVSVALRCLCSPDHQQTSQHKLTRWCVSELDLLKVPYNSDPNLTAH